MEGRLCQAALPQVVLVLAREESLAEEHLGALEAAPFVEETPVRDEHVDIEPRSSSANAGNRS